MKKRIIITATFAACLALCAAVWPRTPVPAAETAVSAKKATVAEIEEPAALPEKEKGAIQQQEAPQEEQPEPKTGPIEMPAVPEHQPSTGRIPTKNSVAEQTPPQVPKELQLGDKVYVAGFGWVEYETHTFTKTATKLESWVEICGKDFSNPGQKKQRDRP